MPRESAVHVQALPIQPVTVLCCLSASWGAAEVSVCNPHDPGPRATEQNKILSKVVFGQTEEAGGSSRPKNLAGASRELSQNY